MRNLRRAALAACLVLTLSPPLARAANTVLIGMSEHDMNATQGACQVLRTAEGANAETIAMLAPTNPGLEFTPDDGAIVSWKMSAATGGGFMKPDDAFARLDVIRPGEDPERPTEIAQSLDEVQPVEGITSRTAHIPVQAGDGLGVDLRTSVTNLESFAGVACMALGSGGVTGIWRPALIQDMVAPAPTIDTANTEQLAVNAEVELDAPVITGLSQASGPLGGGEEITISGQHLANEKEAFFGTKFASRFGENTNTQVVVRVPAGKAEGLVDVTLTTAGGTATLAGGYAYGSAASTPIPTPTPTPGPIPSPAPAAPAGPPAPVPVTPPASKFALPRPKLATGGVIGFGLDAPAAGTFHASAVVIADRGKGANTSKSLLYGSATARAKGAGAVSLKIAPSRAAKALLAKAGRLEVHVTLTFTPATGTGTSHSATVVVHG